jgi:riboflavin kinase / FMN adenylyltransferase
VREINKSEKFSINNPVITTGTFDGVHLGHQKVILHTINIAKKKNGTPVILTFWPHPKLVLGKGDFNLLNTFEEKKQIFKDLGVEHVYFQKFTPEFAQLSSEEYVKTILVEKFGVHTLVVGYDHQFGKERTGKFETLGDLALKYGFSLEKVDALNVNTLSVSSTKIRHLIENGNVCESNEMLGYNYYIEGTVIEGHKIGRKLGFPTANIKLSDAKKMIPGNGVYAVYAKVNEKIYKGALSIGYRPTFPDQLHEKSIEVNLFDFSDTIYNAAISVYFIKKLREEIKFNKVDDLISQLNLDKENAKTVLNGEPKFPRKLM